MENGEPDFTGTYRLIIKDNTYQETGYELLVMQWAENHESTEYMEECFRDYAGHSSR